MLAATRHVVLLEAEDSAGYHTTGRSAALWLQNYGPPDAQALSHLRTSAEPLNIWVAADVTSRQQQALERKRTALNARIAALQSEFAEDEAEFGRLIAQEQAREERLQLDRDEMGRRRGKREINVGES